MRTRGKAGHLFMAGHYRTLGEMVNQIADPVMRQAVADHFATEFRRRYPDGFDPAAWSVQTGGKIQGFNIRTGKFQDGAR